MVESIRFIEFIIEFLSLINSWLCSKYLGCLKVLSLNLVYHFPKCIYFLSFFQSAANDAHPSLSAFMFKEGATTWPKKCPTGYSQHLFAIYDGCEINYCVQVNSLTQIALPVIKRPPFQKEPRLVSLYNNNIILISFISFAISYTCYRKCICILLN